MIFQPFTLGYDWEVPILKPDFSTAGLSTIEEIAHEMRSEQPMTRPGVDYGGGGMLEHRGGVVKCWNALLEKSHAADELARKICQQRNRIYWTYGLMPMNNFPCACHIHVGSIFDPTFAVKLHHAFLKYMPALIALSAHSPVWQEEVGDYKTHRSQLTDFGVASPVTFGKVKYFQASRFDDFNLWVPRQPTIEARCCDSVTSPRLLSELLILWASATAAIGDEVESGYSGELESDFEQYLINRLMATKYGLQATFVWDDGEIEVADIIRLLLELAQPKMKLLKTDPSEMKLIHKMLEKRQTQADMALACYRRNPARHRFFSAYANALENPNLFEAYLDIASQLPTVFRPTVETLILQEIGQETSLWWIHRKLHLSLAMITRATKKLEKAGKIFSTEDPEKGLIYTKT